MREVWKPPIGIAVHARLVYFGWSAVVLLSFLFGISGRVSGKGDEYAMWTDVGFFFAIVALVIGGVLSVLALCICSRSRVAHVLAVAIYGILALLLMAWMSEVETTGWLFLTVLAPAIAGIVLLMLPSSRAWCYGQRSDAQSGPGAL